MLVCSEMRNTWRDFSPYAQLGKSLLVDCGKHEDHFYSGVELSEPGRNGRIMRMRISV